MKWFRFPKSRFPAVPNGRWKSARRYESEITVLVRGMLQDESIRDDQRAAWDAGVTSGTKGTRSFGPADFT